MQEWMRILELENWRVRSLLLVPFALETLSLTGASAITVN
jgi:hypothetical protein